MERGPLIRILENMKGTELELDLIINSRNEPLEIRNVTKVTELHSANGIQIT